MSPLSLPSKFQLGCAVFTTFFYANLSEYGSYLHHINMFWYISKNPLFASVASYSLQNSRTDLHTEFNMMQKNTCCKKYLLQSEYLLKISHSDEYLHQNICFRREYSQNFKRISHSCANICIQANIRLQIVAYQ